MSFSTVEVIAGVKELKILRLITQIGSQWVDIVQNLKISLTRSVNDFTGFSAFLEQQGLKRNIDHNS